MLSYCSMKIIALCLLYFLQSHNGYIWKTSPFTARSRHLILKNSNQPEGFPKATSMFDLGRQKLKEEAAKLREEADREVLKSQENSTISEIHVAADVKGFVVEKAYIPESKENFPYFMNNGTISDPNLIQSKPSTKPLDIAFSGVYLKDLPSYEPLLNYLRVIRKFDIQKFDKNGIARDDRYLSTEGEEESFYDDDFAKNSFIKIMKMQLKDIPDPIDDDLLFISTFNVVNYAFSKAKKPNSLFNIFEGPMSSLLQKVSFQDGSDLIDFYEALRDYVKWRNDPKVKSLFEQVDLIYGSSNDISSSLAFPRVPFGLRPAITHTTILKEKYWNYFLDANLTNTYPLSSYLTLLSTAYATNPSSSSSDSIIEETLQVLPAYFNALMKYNIKRLTEAGFPDISYVLQQKNRNLLDKLISVDEKLSKDIDRRLYLTAFLLVFENNQSADEKKLQSETDSLYKVFQRLFLWQTKFNNAGSTSTLSTNQLAALYQKYSQANEILIDKQKDRFINPVNFLTNPTPPNNIFFQLLTRSNNQQHSLQSENQNLFRVDEEATSVIMQYQRVLQEFKAEQFKKDPFSGLVLSNELLPKNQDGIGIVEERIKKNWERKKLVKRDWLDEDFELYKLASLIYYRSLFGEEKVNILSLLDENDDDEDVNEEEDQELASIFERIVQESDPSIKSTNLSMNDFFKEFKNGVSKMKEQNKKGQAKKQQEKSINDGDEVDLSDFLEKVLFDFDSDQTQTKEEFERQSYSFLFFSMLFTPEDEKIERIFTVLRNYKTWRFSEVGKNLWQQATAEEEKRGKEDAEDDSIKLKYGGSLARSVFFEEPLEDFQYFYQNDYLIAPPFNAFYSILFNAYKLFGPSVKFSEIMTIFAKGSPQPYLITKSTKEGLKKLSSTKGEKYFTTKEADLAALLESTRKRIEENREGIPKINQSSEDNPLLVSTSLPPTPKSDRNVTEVMENLLQSILVNNASSPTQELIRELAGEYGSEAERFVSTVFYQPSNEIALRKTVESLIDKLIVRENVDTTEDESEEGEFQNKGEKEEFTLTKQFADEIRLNILKDVNLHAIRSYKGAYILQSETSEGREAQELCRKIEKRFQQFSNYSTLVDYAIIYDELIPKDLTDEDLVKMALDRPRVTLIIHPKKWKTTALNRMENSRFVNPALTVAYLISTITFAVRTVGQSLNPDDINPATFASNGLLPMIAVALSLQIFSSVVEQVIGKSKGLSMKSYFLPSFGDVFSFGVHNAVKELPKNRRDIFDTFLSGILPTLLLSFVCMVAGLNSIKDLTVDQISHLPTISLGFLRSNHLIETFITTNYPQLFYDVDVSKASTLLHLPWLTIAGMGSFVGNIFRLLPFDHASVGRKLSYAVFGSRGDAFFVTILGIVKVVLLLSIGLFSDMSLASLPKELLFQYLVLVSLLPENAAPLVSKNDVSEVGELRKIIYFFVMFFAFVCFLPSDWNVSGVQENVQSLFPNLF